MTSQSFIIIDRSQTSGTDLRTAVVNAGDTAHIFRKFEPALELIKRKKIEAVLVEFDTDKETTDFCASARMLGVPVIYLSTPMLPFDTREYGFMAAFPDLPNAPRLPVQYAHC